VVEYIYIARCALWKSWLHGNALSWAYYYIHVEEQYYSVATSRGLIKEFNKEGGISCMSMGILFIIFSIIVFFTLCLCSISKKETPMVHQDPEQIHNGLKIEQMKTMDPSISLMLFLWESTIQRVHRKKMFYGELPKSLGEAFRDLAVQKDCHLQVVNEQTALSGS